MSHVRPRYYKLANRKQKITLHEWKDIACNSFEQKLLVANLQDSAFIIHLKYCLENCNRDFDEVYEFEICSTYDEAMRRELLPQMVRRFESLINENKRLQGVIDQLVNIHNSKKKGKNNAAARQQKPNQARKILASHKEKPEVEKGKQKSNQKKVLEKAFVRDKKEPKA